MKKALQNAALRLYRLVQATGVLRTAPGRAAFEWAYDAYKSLFEARHADLLRPLVRPGATVIDVGANIGFFTRRFAAWVADGGRVIAIEPDRDNFLRLQRNLQRQGHAAVVELIEGAAAECNGTLRLLRNPLHPGDHHLAEEGVAVRAVTLDELLVQHGRPEVSLIKIDVQGAELRVLQGACDTLRRCRPALYLELDDNALRRSGASSARLLDELEVLGYRCVELMRNGELVPLDRNQMQTRRAGLGYGDFLFVAVPSQPS